MRQIVVKEPGSRAREEWIEGDQLWRVGFTLRALNLINLLSGLVEIQEVTYDARHQAVVFFLKNLDQSNTLFKNGAITGAPICSYRPSGQPLLVDNSLS